MGINERIKRFRSNSVVAVGKNGRGFQRRAIMRRIEFLRNRILIGMSYVGYAYIGYMVVHVIHEIRLDLTSRKICIAVIEGSSFVPIFRAHRVSSRWKRKYTRSVLTSNKISLRETEIKTRIVIARNSSNCQPI